MGDLLFEKITSSLEDHFLNECRLSVLILTGFLHRLPLAGPLLDREPVPVSGAVPVCWPDLPGVIQMKVWG